MTTQTLPRQPLRNEMFEAFNTALDETDPQRAAFYTGLGTGYAIAFNLVTREALDRARLTPGAANVHIDFRKPRWDDDEQTLWACGIRHGYSLAVSERPDQGSCDMCGEAYTNDDPTEGCEHGTFCATGCIQDWHTGVTLNMCTYLDGAE